MKQYTIDELKKYILNELQYESICEDEEEEKYYKDKFDILFDELCDISKKEFRWLDERDTFIIRKLFGILDGGIFQTQDNVGKIFNISGSRIGAIKRDIIRKMKRLILNYIILSKEYKTTVMLSDPIQKLDLPFSIFSILHRNDIKTIEDLTLTTQFKLSKIIGSKYCRYVIEHINKFGFNVKSNLENEDFLSSPIEDLNLSVKTYNCLKYGGVDTIGKLISLDVDKLLKIRNMGLRNVNEISIVLNKYGLSLSKSDVNESLNKKSDLNTFVEPNNTSEFDCISKYISFLDKYKSLLLEKKQLQHRLNEIDMEIMNLLEQRNKEYTENIQLRK